MDALESLRLQIEWGADEALEERAPPPSPRPARAEPPASPAAAAAADSLAALRAALAGLDCALARTATSLVFADGNPASGLVFVGEAPGDVEDVEGRPLAGPVGGLFDRMLASIGLDRSTSYIVNLIPWRPPGGRAPTAQEVALCHPFLQRHLELVAPRLIVTLGALPTQALLGTSDTIGRLRGRWRTLEVAGALVRLLPMLHPGFLVRAPARKRDAWRDLLALQSVLQVERAVNPSRPAS